MKITNSYYFKYIFLVIGIMANGQFGFSQNRAPSCWLNYQDHFQGDILINTLRVYPPSPTYTYYSALTWNAGQEGGGYCGMQEHPDGRNFIYSIWDPINSNDPITVDYQGVGTSVENFGGEGTGLKSWNFDIGWETLQWYSFITRSWDQNNHTMFGFWVYDYTNSIWHHLITMDYPVEGVRFNSNTGSFIEDWFGNGEQKREIHHKNGWKRKTSDLTWNAFTTALFNRVSPDAGAANYIENYDGGVIEDFYFMKSGSTEVQPNTNVSNSSLSLDSQSEVPDFEKGSIANLILERIDNNLSVSWNISDSSLPQFSYHFKIFDNPELAGNPILSVESITPHAQSINLNISALSNGNEYYTLFYIVDIFDNRSEIYTGNLSTASINYPPSISDTSYSIDENIEQGTSLGLVSASDPEGKILSFSIISGNELGAFQIEEGTGEILIANSASLNFEANPTFNLLIQVSDGILSSTALAHVNLNNLNETPSISDASFSIAENSEIETKVGTVSASDPENDNLSFTMISGNELGAFKIDQSSGEITVANSSALDFETNPIFELLVEVNDGTLSNTATIVVNLEDLDEIVLGFLDKYGNNIKIYPNPANEIVNIEWINFKQASISELSGKQIIQSTNKTIDLRILRSGTYLITITALNDEQITFRFVKE